MTTVELIIGVTASLLILGMFFGSFAFVFLWFQATTSLMHRKYPVKVPKTKARMSSHPPFNATAADVARAMRVLAEHAEVKKGYDKKLSVKKLGNVLIKWIPADPTLGGKRAVYDPHGRKDEDGDVIKVAGWHTGDMIYVVYLEKDTIESVALVHEFGHELHEEIEKRIDYKHEDVELFGSKTYKDGAVQRAKQQLRCERVYGEAPRDYEQCEYIAEGITEENLSKTEPF